MADQGLIENVLGHVSVRVDDGRILIRCRGSHERGLIATRAEDVRLCDLAGTILDAPAGEYRVPYELPIHRAVYLRRPEASAVVHAHPPTVLLAGLASVELRPVIGADNIPALRMALAGVPVWDRSALVASDELADELLAAMGERDVCIMRGHGITVWGSSVAQATVRSIDLNTLARVNLDLARLGAVTPPVSQADIDLLPDLGVAFNDDMVWNFYAGRAARAHEGLASR